MKTITSQIGLWLTQKELADENQRFFTQEIWLGKFDKAENYIEVDNAYKEAWEEKYLTAIPEE